MTTRRRCIVCKGEDLTEKMHKGPGSRRARYGLYCAGCKRFVPQFETVDEEGDLVSWTPYDDEYKAVRWGMDGGDDGSKLSGRDKNGFAR